jgi:hypothetical protein
MRRHCMRCARHVDVSAAAARIFVVSILIAVVLIIIVMRVAAFAATI